MLRVVFMGSPDFAVPSLEAVARAHQVVAVVSQPDRPSGRGRRVVSPPVKISAERLRIPVIQPRRLRSRAVREQLETLRADVFVVVAYGQILSRRTLGIPKLGCINVHGSILPRYRGAAPIQWAVLNGEKESGVSIMQMDEGVDTGPVYASEVVALCSDETAGSLHDRLAPLGAQLLVKVLKDVEGGTARADPQNHDEATYARMLTKSDGRVDFGRTASRVGAWIRGMDPWPGAFTTHDNVALKLFGSEQSNDRGEPGEVLAVDRRGMLIACGDGSVWVTELQRPGRKRMPAQACLAGYPVTVGTRLES